MTIIFLIVGFISGILIYRMGVNHGQHAAVQAVTARVTLALYKLPWQERQSFKAALIETIKEEKQKQ